MCNVFDVCEYSFTVMLSYAKVGVGQEYFYAVVIAQGGVHFLLKPCYEFFVALHGCAVVVEDVNARIFKVLSRGADVVDDATAAVALGAT